MDEKKSSRRGKFVAPVLVTVAVVALVGGMIALIAWAVSTEVPPGPLLAYLGVYVLAGAGVIFGILYCLRQRIEEIKGGEEDEARKY